MLFLLWALQTEMTEHPGHDEKQLVANEACNTRNGRSKKTIKDVLDPCPLRFHDTALAPPSHN